MPESLSRRAGRAVVWTALSTASIQALGIVKMVVLARLLSREDFGVVGVGMITIGAIEAVTNTGFAIAIWQRREPSPAVVHTAYTVGLIRGLILTAAVVMLAPLVGAFFHSASSVGVVRWMAISILLTAIASMGRIELQRSLSYRDIAKVEITASLVDAIGSVAAALLLRNAYALVIGFLARAAVNAIGFYLIHPWRPRLVVVWSELLELFRFGRWISLTVTLWFLSDQLDRALVGKLLGVERLGLYTMAASLANVPYTFIQYVVSRVVFSSYVEISTDKARLSRTFARVLFVLGSMSLAAAAFGLQFSQPLIPFILGDKWRAIVACFNILLVAGLLRGLAVDATSQLFIAVGKPILQTIANLVRLVGFCAAVYPLFRLNDMQGVAWASLAGSAVSGALAIGFTRGRVHYHGRGVLVFVVNVAAAVGAASLGAQLVSSVGPPGTLTVFLSLGAWLVTLAVSFGALQLATRPTRLDARSFLQGSG